MKINITLDRGSQRELFHSNYFCPCFVPLPYESTSPLKTFLEMFTFRLEFFLGSFQLWSEAALAGKAATQVQGTAGPGSLGHQQVKEKQA